MERQDPGGQQQQARIHPDQQAGDDRVGQGPGDNPVDVVQPVPQDRHPDAYREDGETEIGYKGGGSLTVAGACGTSPETTPVTPVAKLTAHPASSHFSCCRRTMLARRQLSSNRAPNDSQNTTMIGKITVWTGASQAVPREELSKPARPPLASMRTSWATMRLTRASYTLTSRNPVTVR